MSHLVPLLEFNHISCEVVHSQLKPKLMRWLCVDALVREKIEVRSYTRLTKLILGAINRRKQELATIIEHTLDQDARGLLDGLLTQEPIEGGTTPGKTSAYKLPRCFAALRQRSGNVLRYGSPGK